MRRTTGSVPTLLSVILLVAACGGSAGTPADPGGGAASADPGGGGGAAPSVDVPASAGAPSSAPAAGGGGGAGDTCGLVTATEMDAIFGVSGVTQDLLEGPPDTCDYQLDGAPFAATVWTPDVQPYVYDAMTADSGSTPVSGIGDRAVYNESMRLLVVEKNGSLFTVAVFDESKTDDQKVELMKAIATKAAERL